MKKRYVVVTEGWILDEYRRKGDIVVATEAVAHYAVMAGSIQEEAAKVEAAAEIVDEAPAPKRARAKKTSA